MHGPGHGISADSHDMMQIDQQALWPLCRTDLKESNIMKPYYVVGHKNPDCDAIVSAIAYAALKRKLGIDAEARAQGTANPETLFLLKKYHFEQPPVIHTAKCSLAEIEKDTPVLARPDMTMKEALDLVITQKNRGMLVTDEEGHLEGVVSVSDLTRFWITSEENMVELMTHATLDNIIKVLDAKVFFRSDAFSPSGVVHAVPSLSDNPERFRGSIVILRNSPDIQRFVIENRAALIIICGEDWIDNVTLEKAKEKGVSVIRTPYSVLDCTKYIYQAPPIEVVTTRNVMSFNEKDMVDDVTKRLAKSRFRSYPVLDDEGRVKAAISRYHLFNYEKKRFILVDHNEESQSVNDLEFGEVAEIVDHHRMGGIETVNPINITERVIGSTATIITGMYRSHGIEPDHDMAGLLLGGVVNDTLCLKSPTTTDEDREAATYLSGIAGITPEALNEEMIGASMSILNKPYLELLYDDFKEFRIENTRVGIGQSPCKSKEEFFRIRDGFLAYMNEVIVSQHYDLLAFLFTDPAGTGSYMIYTGKKAWVMKEGFQNILDENGFAPGIMSRKKQILPVIIDTLNK